MTRRWRATIKSCGGGRWPRRASDVRVRRPAPDSTAKARTGAERSLAGRPMVEGESTTATAEGASVLRQRGLSAWAWEDCLTLKAPRFTAQQGRSLVEAAGAWPAQQQRPSAAGAPQQQPARPGRMLRQNGLTRPLGQTHVNCGTPEPSVSSAVNQTWTIPKVRHAGYIFLGVAYPSRGVKRGVDAVVSSFRRAGGVSPLISHSIRDRRKHQGADAPPLATRRRRPALRFRVRRQSRRTAQGDEELELRLIIADKGADQILASLVQQAEAVEHLDRKRVQVLARFRSSSNAFWAVASRRPAVSTSRRRAAEAA